MKPHGRWRPEALQSAYRAQPKGPTTMPAVPANLHDFAGVVVRAEAPIIRHNTHLRGAITITCGRHTCTLVAHSRRTGRARFHLRLNYRHAATHRDVRYEDYSGWITYRHASWYLDPPCQAASPCVDG